VSRSGRRSIVSLVVAPLFALSATFAPEHVHESDADHPHAVTHRHFETHHSAAHDHGGAEIEHGDDHVVWVDGDGAYQPTYQLPMPDPAISDRFELAPAPTEWIATSIDESAPPHGPPRGAPSLRAPPQSRLLI
jgi:hypothetical protein